jgi:hypothetical protein
VRRGEARPEVRSASAELVPQSLRDEADFRELPGRRNEPGSRTAPVDAPFSRTQPLQSEEPAAVALRATAAPAAESAQQYDVSAAQEELSSRISDLVDRFEDVLRRIERFIGSGLTPGEAGGVRDLAVRLAAVANNSDEAIPTPVRASEESDVLAAVLQRASEVFDDLVLAGSAEASTDLASSTSTAGRRQNNPAELNLVL